MVSYPTSSISIVDIAHASHVLDFPLCMSCLSLTYVPHLILTFTCSLVLCYVTSLPGHLISPRVNARLKASIGIQGWLSSYIVLSIHMCKEQIGTLMRTVKDFCQGVIIFVFQTGQDSHVEGHNTALCPARTCYLYAIQMVRSAPGYQYRENEQVYRQSDIVEVRWRLSLPILEKCKNHEICRGHTCRSKSACRCVQFPLTPSHIAESTPWLWQWPEPGFPSTPELRRLRVGRLGSVRREALGSREGWF